MKTSISFLKSKFTKVVTINNIMNTDADYIHVDFMDGTFVDNYSITASEVNDLLYKSAKPLDIHLMLNDPAKYIIEFSNLNARYITIHYEIEEDKDKLFDLIHSYGIRAGLAINPETRTEDIIHLLDKVDYVLIMGVIPGAGGQKFIPEMSIKIDELKRIRENYDYHYMISVDGGVNEETAYMLKGADILVSGSFICMADDYQKQIDKIKNIS